MKNFGGIMKAQMKRLGIKQEVLAKELNIGRTTVTAYCNDKRQPDLETISKICNLLEINLSWLLQIPDLDNSIMFIKNDFELRVNEACRQVSKEDQMRFIEGVEYLVRIMNKRKS